MRKPEALKALAEMREGIEGLRNERGNPVKRRAREICRVIVNSSVWPIPAEVKEELRARAMELDVTAEEFETAWNRVLQSEIRARRTRKLPALSR